VPVTVVITTTIPSTTTTITDLFIAITIIIIITTTIIINIIIIIIQMQPAAHLNKVPGNFSNVTRLHTHTLRHHPSNPRAATASASTTVPQLVPPLIYAGVGEEEAGVAGDGVLPLQHNHLCVAVAEVH